MAAENFGRCFALTLKHEGGYVDDPADLGGATNLGVSIGTLLGWLGRPATKSEVRALTREAVAPIYRKNFCDRVRGDALPAGLDFAVYDFAVNSGPKRAAMALQRALGVADDGVIGSMTLASVAGRPVDQIIERVDADRLSFMRRLSTWPRFGKGWTTRVNEVTRQALDMAQSAPASVGKVETKPLPPPAPAMPPLPAPPQAATPASPGATAPKPSPPPAAPTPGLFARMAERLRAAFPPKKDI